MLEDIEEVLVTQEEIQGKVKEIAAAISRDYAGRDLVLVGVLRGATVFLSDLLKQITIPVTIDFMAISSYGPAQESSGIVRLVKDLDEQIKGRDVLLVEDIIDTGLTVSYLLRSLSARNPVSLKVCTLLDKSSRRKVPVPIAYLGFQIPDKFVVGYGLDYNQKYRNLPFVASLKKEVFSGQ